MLLAVQCASFSIHCAVISNGSPFPKPAATERHRVRVSGVIKPVNAPAILTALLSGGSEYPTPSRLTRFALSGWSQAIGRFNWGIPAAMA
jgi:hypothetical protein